MRLNNNDSIGRTSRVGGQDGMALITVMMVMMLISVLMVGFVAAIVADNRASGLDRDQTQAYAASHAGLEKLTSDLSTLFTVDFSPSAAQVNALAAAQPTVYGFTYVAPNGGLGLHRDVHAGRQRQPEAARCGQRHADQVRPVSGLQGHHHAVRHHDDGALDRRRRSAHAPQPADDRRPGVPVRDVLGNRPRVPRRRVVRLRRPRPHQRRTCTSPTATARR